jgi:ribokinase
MNCKSITVLGSINIDQILSVPHIVSPGETLSTTAVHESAGGKGANQAVAIARAGSSVRLVAKIGSDGIWIKDLCQKNGVNIEFVNSSASMTGKAIIQVDKTGENSILLLPGGNKELTMEEIDRGLEQADIVLLQNEINYGDYAIQKANQQNSFIVLNPSPFTPNMITWNWKDIDLLILNKREVEQICEMFQINIDISLRNKYLTEKILQALGNSKLMSIIITLGSEGIIASHAFSVNRKTFSIKAAPLLDPIVETTGAGDCFTGYLISGLVEGRSFESSCLRAVSAAAICICRKGAMESIPFSHEVDDFMSSLPTDAIEILDLDLD